MKNAEEDLSTKNSPPCPCARISRPHGHAGWSWGIKEKTRERPLCINGIQK